MAGSDRSGADHGRVLFAYTYITPLLTDRAGIPAGAVPLVLIAYGTGALGGTTLGGRMGDRKPMATSAYAAGAMGLATPAPTLAPAPPSSWPISAKTP